MIIKQFALISLMSATSFLAALPTALAQDASLARVAHYVETLSTFGANEAGGIDRVAYSDADLAARDYMMAQMKAAGLAVRIDAVGNIIGRRAGKNNDLPPIMFGSHIDSVPGGGNYDGQVGSMGALEVMNMLNDANVTTDHPLEMILFQNEEGGPVGSSAVAGLMTADDLDAMTTSGYSIREGITRLGGTPDHFKEAHIKTPIHAFMELHIEQGGFLDAENLDIGVVEGIVGIRWWDVTVEGYANHGGTTPMPGRRDALVAASKLVVAINELATNTPGRQVATVGRIQAFPGAPNVIPGKVVMSLEIRDLDAKKMNWTYEAVKERAAHIAEDMNVSISFDLSNVDNEPAPTDRRIRKMVEASAQKRGLSYKYMPSGAGHDAQHMAVITPTGMIFVPSKKGVSHSPKEFTANEDIVNGANVLYETIMTLDKADLK